MLKIFLFFSITKTYRKNCFIEFVHALGESGNDDDEEEEELEDPQSPNL